MKKSDCSCSRSFWKWMEPRDTLNTTVSAAAALLLAALSQSSQPGTSSSSSSSEYQNMPHSTFTFFLPSDHQLSSHFLEKIFSSLFFLLKKMKGEKNVLLIFLCVESKERRVPETISAAAGGGGWWMMDWLLKWFSEKERKNWKSNCFPDISNNVADPLTISWWWLSAVVMWLVIELVNKSASSSASLSLLFSNRIYYV